jgi:hypothetical protein
LPARECAHAGLALVGEADELDHLGDVARPLVVTGEEVEDLAHGEEGIDGRGLEDDSDPRPEVGSCAAGVDPKHLDAPVVALAIALQDLDGGRLSRAVRAKECEHLSRLDAEADAVQDLARPVRLFEA